MEVESELRVTSDRILSSLDQLNVLESEKRNLKPDSARFQTLAKEIERLAAEIFAQSHAQQRLGVQIQEQAERTGAEPATINETRRPRDISLILADWRDAERRLQLAKTDTAEHALASGDAARLREEYKAAYSAGLDEKRAD